jgi:transcriptional regulator with XRE-family HTH domain
VEKGFATQRELGARLGVTGNAVTKMLGGTNALSYAKLWRLSKVLETDPNTLLGVNGGRNREAFRGTIEGTAVALGYSPAEAAELAVIALGVIDKQPTVGNPADNCRGIAEFLVRQFVELKRK